jgi:hypothetical protein
MVMELRTDLELTEQELEGSRSAKRHQGPYARLSAARSAST